MAIINDRFIREMWSEVKQLKKTIPEKLSDLLNDTNFISESDPIKNNITVEIDTSVIMIPCDAGGKPLSAATYTVNYGITKGGESDFNHNVYVSGENTGIAYTLDSENKKLVFSVSNDVAISESNLFLIIVKDLDLNISISKQITICGARNGKDGADGQDGTDGNEGSPGIGTHVYIRYSPNSNGDPMTAAPTASTRYIGVATTEQNTAPVYGGSYTWTKFVGEDGESPLHVKIVSTNGNIFKNGEINTTLHAVAYRGEKNVTSEFDDNAFLWTRVSSNPEADIIWNQNHYSGTKSIKVSQEDVFRRVTFFCDLVDVNTRQSLL